MLGQEITDHGLTAILVHSLEDLVPRRVAQAGEQRDELAGEGSGSLVLEDDLVQLAGTRDLGEYELDQGGSHVGSRYCRDPLTLVWLLINRFAMVST